LKDFEQFLQDKQIHLSFCNTGIAIVSEKKQLLLIYVLKANRCSRVGTRLVENCLKKYNTLLVEVESKDVIMRNFLENFDPIKVFKKVAKRYWVYQLQWES
jgi:predicted site-specific integrase-resolvase